jgi:hypothetical protein
MPRKAVSKQTASVAISDEARELLALMAEKASSTPSAVLELAIREQAKREQVTLTNGPAPAVEADPKEVARKRFLALLEKAQRHALNDGATPEELEREVTLAFDEVRAERRAGRG